MKRVFIAFLMVMGAAHTHAQRGFNFVYKALDVGVYDYSKPKKNSYKVFREREAHDEVVKLFAGDEELRRSFMYDDPDENGNIVSTFQEKDILEYYPDLGITVQAEGPGDIAVFDIKRKKYICGSPDTFAYSPSGRYRVSGLDYDGITYFLEEKIDGEFVCLGAIPFQDRDISGYYWVDEHTIHYLCEFSRGDGTLYWIGYAGTFSPAK